MNILLYHFGYYGDILVVGQNFAHELRMRFPQANIDLMLRPRMRPAIELVTALHIFRRVYCGEKQDYLQMVAHYEQAFMIDECVYPEGNLRTIFSKAGFPFRIHRLYLNTNAEDDALATQITHGKKRPLIAMQDDMSRKWSQDKVMELQRNLSAHANLITVGPTVVHAGVSQPLSFKESAALLKQVDLFVGIDSGIAHAAALVGTQTILIPPVFPEFWISPTEYANPYIIDEARKHISIRPHPKDFCGHYFCLRATTAGAVKKPTGNPLQITCAWKKRWWFLNSPCCFLSITPHMFTETVRDTLQVRGF